MDSIWSIVYPTIFLLCLIGLIISFSNVISLRDSVRKLKAKEILYQLFLYAEKSGWTNEEKMSWVLQNAIERLSDNKEFANYTSYVMRYWVQSVYNEFKASLADHMINKKNK